MDRMIHVGEIKVSIPREEKEAGQEQEMCVHYANLKNVTLRSTLQIQTLGRHHASLFGCK